MKKISIKPILYGTLLAVILASCAVYEPYERPELETENLYPHDMTLDSTTLASMPWYELFEDPQLQALIEEGLANNYNLRIAVQQIKQAEAYFKESRLAIFPNLSVGGSYAYSDFSESSASGAQGVETANQFTLSGQAQWEVDIWGKLSNAKKANWASLMASEAARRATQTRLISDIATAYYQLMALDAQLEVTRETVENRVAYVETIKILQEGALVTGAAVEQSIANRYAAEVTIPDLKQSIEATENALSILLGRPPSDIQRSEFESIDGLDSLHVGVPAQLLRNRPDIIQAEYQFRSAFELTQSAHAYFYPQLTLTAEGGFQSFDVEDLLDPGSIFANIVGGLTQPIFQNGVNKRRLEVARSQQRVAFFTLKNTIISAGSEVSNSLSQYKMAKQKMKLRAKQLNALENAVSYSQNLLQYGEANYIDVLTAQQQLLGARLNSISDKLQKFEAIVSLYRSLGGGWDKTQGVAGEELGVDNDEVETNLYHQADEEDE